MANIRALAEELINDPLGRGYASMTDQQVADSLNAVDRTKNLGSLSGELMWQQTDPAEFRALTDTHKQLWVSFTRADGVDPFATANVEFVVWIFGSGSTTVSNLTNARTTTISRAEELNLLGRSPEIGPAHVQRARAI